MIVTLAIIMSIMILVLAIFIAGVAVLAYDNSQERDSLRVWKEQLERREDRLNEMRDEITKDVNEHYNNIVNDHL